MTSQAFYYFLVYALVFLAPGWLLLLALNIRANRFLLSLALSYSVSLMTLLVARVIGLSAHAYLLALIGLTLVFSLLVVWRYLRIQSDRSLVVEDWRTKWHGKLTVINVHKDRWLIVPAFALLVGLYIYLIFIGAYLEIPADVWWHLGVIEDQYAMLAQEGIPREHRLRSILEINGDYWYFFPALIAQIAGLTIRQSLPHLAAANMLVMLIGIYGFAIFVFRRFRLKRGWRHLLASVTVLFFVAHFGVNIFSYIRYYLLGPTFLNYLLFLAAMILIARFTEDGRVSVRGVLALLVFTCVMALVHVQEAMFVGLLAATMLTISIWRDHDALGRIWSMSGKQIKLLSKKQKVQLLSFISMIVIVIGVWVVAYMFLPRSYALFKNRLISVENLIPFLRNLYILDPTNQFYQVVTIWGTLVYLLYLSGKWNISRSHILGGGMLLPLLTVFNPFFIDFFLRISYSEVVWRVCYAIPIYAVGAYMIVTALHRLMSSQLWLKKVGYGLVVGLLILLIFPINSLFVVEKYSRLETLRAVAAENDYRQWEDLLDYLQTVESKGVITDRVTGYMINGMTRHAYPGFKFYGRGAVPYNLQGYDEDSFRGRKDWLIVVNRRDGGWSQTGEISSHWSPRVMQVSRHYSPEFTNFLEQNPRRFEKLWSADRISVYRITF